MDYRVATVILTFNQPGMRCTTIQIINDEIPEMPEEFSVILTSVSPSGIIMDDTTCVTIVDPVIENRRFMYTSVFIACLDVYNLGCHISRKFGVQLSSS